MIMPAIVQARVPQKSTLKKYGLNAKEWLSILNAQGGVCAICKRVSKTGRLVTDHEHVKDWKKLAPEHRKLYVRGQLCWFCNHYYCSRAITVEKAKAVVAYLEAYEERRPKLCPKLPKRPKKKGLNGKSSEKPGKIVKPVHCIQLDQEFV
jgi:hypothetical protein